MASSQKDKDEWVEVITAASQVFKEATFTVNGRLTVEGTYYERGGERGRGMKGERCIRKILI